MKRWPNKDSYFWERIPFFRLLIPLVAGIYWYQHSSLTTYHYLLLGLLVSSVVGYTTTALIKKRQGTLRLFNNLFLYTSLILCGWVLSYYQDDTNHKLWFGNSIGKEQAYVIRVLDKAAEKNRTWKMTVRVEQRLSGDTTYNTKGKAYLYVYKYTAPNYQEGDLLIVPDKWQRITNSGNPYEFDYTQYCALQNIHYQQFLSGKEIVEYHIATPEDLTLIRRIHNWCIYQLEYYIHDRATLGLLQAMLVGDRSSLDPDLRQAYASTGIVHVLAISGAHITVFFLLVAYLLSFIKHRKYRWVKYIAALPLIWLYVVVAGAPPSAVRAALMFSILGIGLATQRQQNGVNQLLATAFILLMAQPAWLFSVGFQLSFVAVLSLMLFYQPIYKVYVPSNRILRAIWGTMVASIAAEILIAPLVIYYFHLFPAQFLIANVFAYIFMSVILIAGMSIILFSAIPAIATLIASATIWLVNTFNTLVEWLESLNPEVLTRLTLSSTELLLIYLTIIATAMILLSKKRKAIGIAVSATCLLLVSLLDHQQLIQTQKKLVVYNVNKVNHIELIEGGSYTVLNSSDKLTVQSKYYAIEPAHIQWGTHTELIDTSNKQLFIIADNKVLILDNKPKDTSLAQEVEYLILNYRPKPTDISLIMRIYHPDKIVIGSSLSRKQTRYLVDYRDSTSTPLHIVSVDGAFVLSNH